MKYNEVANLCTIFGIEFWEKRYHNGAHTSWAITKGNHTTYISANATPEQWIARVKELSEIAPMLYRGD